MKYYNTLSTERIGYDFYCDIAERMVEARKKKGWTRAELAKASGIKLSRISDMENVHIRFTLPDVENLAKALDVSVDWLIDAQLDYRGADCLYLVWNEKYEDFKPYQKASSARLAFLKIYQSICVESRFRWFEPRNRAVVKLVGTPINKTELAAKLPSARRMMIPSRLIGKEGTPNDDLPDTLQSWQQRHNRDAGLHSRPLRLVGQPGVRLLHCRAGELPADNGYEHGHAGSGEKDRPQRYQH